jgi:tellurite resistance protein TerC
VINLADLVFAVDSVPAIFAITTGHVHRLHVEHHGDPRASGRSISRWRRWFTASTILKYALALVLVFIGSKIFVSDFLMSGDKFPPVLSLGVTIALIAAGIFYSLWKTRGKEEPDWPATGVRTAGTSTPCCARIVARAQQGRFKLGAQRLSGRF